jgi:hypothetical protein
MYHADQYVVSAGPKQSKPFRNDTRRSSSLDDNIHLSIMRMEVVYSKRNTLKVSNTLQSRCGWIDHVNV